MSKTVLTGLAMLIASLASPAFAAGDIQAGQAKSAACAACHGVDGNSNIAINPKLAGQHADYLAKQIREFQAGNRADPVMMSMVASLSEQDIEDISAYFASQTNAPAIASEETLELGESIYRGGIAAPGVAACLACHGPAGKGNPGAGYPALTGQHAEYTAKTLRDFRSGNRNNDANSAMRSLVKRMTDAEIDAVSNYIQGLN
ncbi:MAG: c-type cytochrome [Pseudomonadota bacterium]